MEKRYTIIYFSSYGFYERFTTYAKNKREAKKICKEHLGTYCEEITEIIEEN